ncbi:hypothetical protein COOONC_26133 [Cooperia oncophora]
MGWNMTLHSFLTPATKRRIQEPLPYLINSREKGVSQVVQDSQFDPKYAQPSWPA